MATSDQPASPEVGVSLPAWLEDADQSAVLLGRLVQDPSIQAALILRGKELWAQAGELLEHAGPELAQKVFQYWSTDGGRDLTRYVRLTSAPGEYILYATGLTGNMVLAILYNEETPFSKMRLQAAELAHTLLSSPLEDEPAKWIQEYPENAQEDNPVLAAALSSLPPLFEDVPPPTVQASPAAGGVPSKKPVSAPPPSVPVPSVPVAVSIQSTPVAQSDPATPQVIKPVPLPSTQPVIPQGISGVGLPPIQPAETISATPDEQVAAPGGLPGAAPISRPAPSFVPNTAPLSAYLPFSTPALSDLYLAVVLLPRLPKRHLTGDLAVLLPQWVAQVCVAYGWRLEALPRAPGLH